MVDPGDSVSEMDRNLAKLRKYQTSYDTIFARKARVNYAQIIRELEPVHAFFRNHHQDWEAKSCLNLIGSAHLRLNHFQEAANLYQQLIDADPSDSLGYYNKGCAESLMGHAQTALTLLKRAFELDRSMKKPARNDPDLETVRKEDEFMILLYPRWGQEPEEPPEEPLGEDRDPPKEDDFNDDGIDDDGIDDDLVLDCEDDTGVDPP